jgi:hypothetical protein
LSICKVSAIIPIDQELFPPTEENLTKASSAARSNSFTQMTVDTNMNFRQFLLRQMYNEIWHSMHHLKKLGRNIPPKHTHAHACTHREYFKVKDCKRANFLTR